MTKSSNSGKLQRFILIAAALAEHLGPAAYVVGSEMEPEELAQRRDEATTALTDA